MNVRTFIVDPTGRRGVWFLGPYGTALLPAPVARATYRHPYCWAAMSLSGRGDGDGGERTIESVRRWPSGAPIAALASRSDRPPGREMSTSATASSAPDGLWGPSSAGV
jgi:uncharacterized protein YqjF (DUF2071 family)